MAEPEQTPQPDRTATGELMLRAFGPFADALGQELARAPGFVVQNLVRLAELITRKRRRVEGQRPAAARVVKQVLDDAGWADNPTVTEYLAGVLAASIGQLDDDRGVSAIAIIRRVSAMQLRAHYVIYSELVRVAPQQLSLNLDDSTDRAALALYVDRTEFVSALGSGASRPDDQDELLRYVATGLLREDLIDAYTAPGQVPTEKELLGFRPSALGVEIFLWGCGSPTVDQRQLLSPGLELVPFEDVPHLGSSRMDLFEYQRVYAFRHLQRGEVEAAAQRLTAMADLPGHRNAPFFFYSAIIAVVKHQWEEARGFVEQLREIAREDQIRGALKDIAVLAPVYPSAAWTFTRLAQALDPRQDMRGQDDSASDPAPGLDR